MKRFVRYQKRILRKSVLTAVIYVTGLLYLFYNIVFIMKKGDAAVLFAKEELLIVSMGIILGFLIHYMMKRKRPRAMRARL